MIPISGFHLSANTLSSSFQYDRSVSALVDGQCSTYKPTRKVLHRSLSHYSLSFYWPLRIVNNKLFSSFLCRRLYFPCSIFLKKRTTEEELQSSRLDPTASALNFDLICDSCKSILVLFNDSKAQYFSLITRDSLPFPATHSCLLHKTSLSTLK